MKNIIKLTLSIAIFLIPFIGVSQNDNEDLALFNKGNSLYDLVYQDLELDAEIESLDTNTKEGKIKLELLNQQRDKILEIALESFRQLIDKYPKSSLIHRSMNNAAVISLQLRDTVKAVEYYKSLISSTANDRDRGGIGRGIMAEPYALYKNRACKKLSEIYLKQLEFDSALIYVELTKKYPYQHFCGNEYASNSIYMSTLYTRSYYGLKEIDKALSYSLPQVFNNGLASNYRLVELTVKILKEKYDHETLTKEFEESVDAYYTETRKHKKDEFVRYYIDYMGYKIEFPSYNLEFVENKEEELKKLIYKSYFFELLKVN